MQRLVFIKLIIVIPIINLNINVHIKKAVNRLKLTTKGNISLAALGYYGTVKIEGII